MEKDPTNKAGNRWRRDRKEGSDIRDEKLRMMRVFSAWKEKKVHCQRKNGWSCDRKLECRRHELKRRVKSLAKRYLRDSWSLT